MRMDKIRLKALAKINLGLDVLHRREDGYHEVRMIMQTIGLHDDLTLRKTKKPGIQVETNLYFLPSNENNLAWKAARLLMEEFPIESGIHVQIDKNIPVAAGLAGGSSDAAAVLWGMNQLFGLGLSRQELAKRGARLGADVPYCVLRGTALAEGIGERLSTLPPMPKCWLAIAKPAASISTRFVYENLHVGQLKPEQHPDVDAMLEALQAQDLRLLASRMGNVLETVTIPACPAIHQIKECMKELGALGAMMSGSGPTVFGIFDSQAEAKAACREIKKKRLAKQVFQTVPYNVSR